MKYYVRSLKITWNFIFWVLFILVVVFTLIDSKTLGISKYFSFILGALLIVNRVYLVKGRIKRWPYFLNILALFFILIALYKFIYDSKNFSEICVFMAAFFSISYFFVASFVMLAMTIKIHSLVQDNLTLEVPLILVRSLIMSFLCLAAFYPFVTLHIKRLRDINLSYWWTLATLIPGINILFEIFLFTKKSVKRKKKNKNKKKKLHRAKVKAILNQANLKYNP
ncbi:MAG: DUF805 domain-containing protein [Bdellovibrionales bacterium]|nr:DUF805 domain-containing protein [Bdellovibrionales bacterium]